MSDDEDFKDWMKDSMKELRAELHIVKGIAYSNAETLRRYLWFWRIIKVGIAASAALIASNWEHLLKAVGKH